LVLNIEFLCFGLSDIDTESSSLTLKGKSNKR
jgi:hypothetical protein